MPDIPEQEACAIADQGSRPERLGNGLCDGRSRMRSGVSWGSTPQADILFTRGVHAPAWPGQSHGHRRLAPWVMAGPRASPVLRERHRGRQAPMRDRGGCHLPLSTASTATRLDHQRNFDEPRPDLRPATGPRPRPARRQPRPPTPATSSTTVPVETVPKPRLLPPMVARAATTASVPRPTPRHRPGRGPHQARRVTRACDRTSLQRHGCYIGAVDNAGSSSALKAQQENAARPLWRRTLRQDSSAHHRTTSSSEGRPVALAGWSRRGPATLCP